LGSYLLWDTKQKFVDLQLLGVAPSNKPGPTADFTVEMDGSAVTFTLPSRKRALAVNAGSKLVSTPSGQPLELGLTTGCESWPEAEVNVTGAPFGGASSHQEVRGYLDGHTHGMAFEFLGGNVHCGRPWHPYGIEAALKDCPDHELARGAGAVLEN